MSKEVVPAQLVLTIFTNKFRGDLIVCLLKQCQLPYQASNQLVENLIKNTLRFDQDSMIQIFFLLISKEQNKNQRWAWGVGRLLQESLKITNETIKSVLMAVLYENITLLVNLKETRIIEQFIQAMYSTFLVKDDLFRNLPSIYNSFQG